MRKLVLSLISLVFKTLTLFSLAEIFMFYFASPTSFWFAKTCGWVVYYRV